MPNQYKNLKWQVCDEAKTPKTNGFWGFLLAQYAYDSCFDGAFE